MIWSNKLTLRRHRAIGTQHQNGYVQEASTEKEVGVKAHLPIKAKTGNTVH